MIDPNTKLTILHESMLVFEDNTNDLADFGRDDVFKTLTTSDYLYVGFEKPFGAVYTELQVPNTNEGTLTVEYFDGTSWTTANPNDETKMFTRSGFIFWDKEDMKSTSVGPIEGFYIRMSVSVDTSEMTMRGLNLVFSDDTDLATEFDRVNDTCLYPKGYNSHVLMHVSSRNHMIQTLRNEGYVKLKDCKYDKIDQFDFMDILEFRTASTYLTLSKIFFNMADSPESIWWTKYREYSDKFEQAFNLVRNTLDKDDDGLTDSSEKQARSRPFRWSR